MTSTALFIVLIIGYALIIGASIALGKLISVTFPTFITRLEQLSEKKGRIILFCAMIIIALFFTWYAFQKYDGFGYYIFDQGNMEQTVWNTLHGDWFRLTTQGPATNRLHFHVEPIFIILVPLYAIWESGKVLLLVQILLIVSGAYAVFRLARVHKILPLYSLIISFGYLLYPIVWRSTVTDFHPLALGAPLMIFGALSAFEKKFGISVIFFLLALASREEYAIMVLIFGSVLFFLRDRKLSYVLISMGALWILFVTLIVIPTFSPTNGLMQANYYSYISDQGINAKEFIITRIAYVMLLFGPLLFFSLRSPFIFIGIISFITIVLRFELPFFLGAFHNHVSLLPAFFISAVLGISEIIKRYPLRMRIIGLSIIIASVGFSIFFLFSPAGIIQEEDRFFSYDEAREIRELFSSIPREASVISANEFGEMLPARKNIFLLESTSLITSDFIVVPKWKEAFCPVWSRGSAACTANEKLYADVLAELRSSHEYALFGEASGVYVYNRVGE